MTLNELQLVLRALTFDDDTECGEAISLVKRDIRLKKLNPVKDKDSDEEEGPVSKA